MEKKNSHILRIALLGPECTAKSTLAAALARHYHTQWVPEHARNYLSGLNRKYVLNDVVNIAKLQLEDESLKMNTACKYIFADTELIIAKVWCMDVFHTCPQWISETLMAKKYDYYLLTSPDLPWEEDALRENPHRREFLFEWYLDELKKLKADYTIIKGHGEERLANCIKAIEQLGA